MQDTGIAPATLAYAHIDRTDASDASARAFRWVGTLLLAAILGFVACESLVIVIVICVNAAMVEFGSPGTIVYLVSLPATAIVSIVTLRRMRTAPLPMPPATERGILWGWRWLALIGLINAGVQAAVSLDRTFTQWPGGLPAGWWLGLAISNVGALIASTMPMLAMLLIARRPLAAWPRRLAALLLVFFLPRVLRLDLIREIASWLAALRTSGNPTAELIQLGQRFAPWVQPWICVVLTLPLALAILRKPHRSTARGLALICLGWAAINAYAQFRNQPSWFYRLALSPYQLRDALLTMSPAWVLGWLSFQPQDMLGNARPVDRVLLADPVANVVRD